MTLCISAAGKIISLGISAFTLSWTHSVERTRWEEWWQITDGLLTVEEAQVEGAGAGVDLPDGAVRVPGGWRYRPRVPPLHSVTLAASGMTPSGWTLCSSEGCHLLGDSPGEPIRLWTGDDCGRAG